MIFKANIRDFWTCAAISCPNMIFLGSFMCFHLPDIEDKFFELCNSMFEYGVFVRFLENWTTVHQKLFSTVSKACGIRIECWEKVRTILWNKPEETEVLRVAER